MGGSVFAYQSGSVETEHYGQAQQCHVVDDIIIGTLCKRTVDITEGLQSVFRHSSGEGDSMSLGDTYVEGAVGHGFHHDIHRTAGRHRWGHSHDVRVLFRQFEEGLTEYFLIFRGDITGVADDTLAGLRIKLTWRMPDGSRLLRRLVALAFHGVQVQQLRSFHILQLSEDTYQFLDIMSVEGSEIADIHSFEDILLVTDGRFHRIGQSDDAVLAVLSQQSFAVQPACRLETQPVVGLVRVEMQQVVLHTSHGTVDRHIVVIEDDEQVVG